MLVVVLYGVILLLSHHQSMWIIPGSSKKNSHPVKLIAKKLARPLSPNSMLLHRFAWKGFQKRNRHFGSDAGMHWATTLIKGAWGDQV